MTKFTSIAAITLAALTAMGATPAVAQSDFDAHVRLYQQLNRSGVTVTFNDAECWEDNNLFGWYYGPDRQIVICQEHATDMYKEADWTEEDLDTLRHEAQHFVQDCMVGTNYDQEMAPLYEQPVALGKQVMGTESVQNIAEAYSDLDTQSIILEIEAFAVATMNDPDEQVADIQKYCF